MSSLARRWRVVAIPVVGLAALAAVLFLFFPAGETTPEDAVLGKIRSKADAGTARVLVEQPWGDGELVLGRYESDGREHVSFAVTIERGRGWRIVAYTEQRADPQDVKVGSLLVSSSDGGKGIPAWSAAVGRLSDGRVQKVEVTWADDEKTTAERRNDAYLVVREGREEPDVARYLAPDGTEIAKVPARSYG